MIAKLMAQDSLNMFFARTQKKAEVSGYVNAFHFHLILENLLRALW